MTSAKSRWGGLTQAFGGGELAGDCLVRFIYLDESGVGSIEREPVFVVAGVIVHADRQWKEIEDRLAVLADRHVPKAHRPDFVFHATELFSGGGTFDRQSWSKESRWAILEDILKIPSEMGLPVVWAATARRPMVVLADMGNRLKRGVTLDPLEMAHSLSVMACAHEAHGWMEEHAEIDELAQIVAEDTTQRRAAIKKMFNEIRSDQFRNEYVSFFPQDADRGKPLQRIVNSVQFSEKRESAPLQLADACAFAIRRYLSHAQGSAHFFDLLKPQLTRKVTRDIAKTNEDFYAPPWQEQSS
ncbi:MAG: DUF3800 domain-containing protein [Hyphomonadaceae bacterium]|nr:MAG: hypothetical protein FD160_1692 [Caulobacteraceae bacterium]MBT9447748.1 DUF3800 domain-containing protein [Hyphomonadaceae bacterium]TPW02716.1 MAG: hypothetical protein FD124_3282 [Alphaproteobacteria bacterium]